MTDWWKPNTNDKEWRSDALAHFVDYALCNGEFMTEDVRKYAESLGLQRADDPRAWGGIVKSCIDKGIVRVVRYDKSKTPWAHGRPTAVLRCNLDHDDVKIEGLNKNL